MNEGTTHHAAHHGGHGDSVIMEAILEHALHNTSSFGVLVLVFATFTTLLNFVLLLFQHATGFRFFIKFSVTQPKGSPLTLDRIKLELARMVGFALLLLVALDVLETLSKPAHAFEMDELYKMSVIGALRTTLAYFLGKETEEIMHHIEHEEHHPTEEEHDTISSSPPHNEEKATQPIAAPKSEAPSRNSSGGKNKKKNKQN